MQGFHGDNCATVGVGTINNGAQRLMDATQVQFRFNYFQNTNII